MADEGGGQRIPIIPGRTGEWLETDELRGGGVRQLRVRKMHREMASARPEQCGELVMAVRDWCALLDWFSQEYWKDVTAAAVEQSQKETPTIGGANDELP